MVLRNGATPPKDLLKWKIARGGQATAADLGDPVGGSAVTVGVCLYDASATAQPLLAGTVLGGGTCNGKPCWKNVAGGHRYRDKSGSADGVTDVKLRVGKTGELGLVVKGRGDGLALPALGLVTPVRLQLVVGDPGGTACWESSFTSAVKNDAAVFKANGS